MTYAAPFLYAPAAKVWPSTRSPGKQTNTQPGATLRLSVTTALMGSGSASVRPASSWLAGIGIMGFTLL